MQLGAQSLVRLTPKVLMHMVEIKVRIIDSKSPFRMFEVAI